MYEAMNSNRSYRGVLPREQVRNEIKNGMGTQFEPKMAGIMLQIIEEDKEYKLREW